MIRLFILDVPEFRPVIDALRTSAGVSERPVGDHVELSAENEITVERRAAGVGPAIWYSVVGALVEGDVVQFDRDALRVVAGGSR